MPAKPLMTWDARNRRWRKFYKGRRIPPVSCKQLSEWSGKPLPETKEGSYQVANAWWLQKKAEIDGDPPDRYGDVFETLTRRRDWARRKGMDAEARFIGRCIDLIERGEPAFIRRMTDDLTADDMEDLARGYQLVNELVLDLPHDCGGHDPDASDDCLGHELEAREAIHLDSILWNDRVTRDDPEPVPEDRTVGGLTRRFLDAELLRYNAGYLSASEYDLIRLCVEAFRDWAGPESAVERIDARRWEGYWAHLLGAGISREYKLKRLRHARNLLAWAHELGEMPLLPNLHSRKYRFGGGAKAVPTMRPEEVRMLVERATGQLKLHLLLMANCGMYQIDISELRQEEVDWDAGRITRKRTKERNEVNVPIVSYKLWPRTLELLREHRSGDAERVLLTKSGRPWVVDRIEEGRRVKGDSIATNYAHLRRKLKGEGVDVKPLKVLRKTSASLLDTDEVYGRYAEMFLGHAPRSIVDRHYRNPSGEIFDQAVTWLGEQYGLM
jgi:integrase